jgi:hypothetical protein
VCHFSRGAITSPKFLHRVIKYTQEADRAVVKKKIIDRYRSVPSFNKAIIDIVDKIFI